MRSLALLATTLSVFIGTSALADDPGTSLRTARIDSKLTFEAIDRNADRRISKTEAGSYKGLIDNFALIDTDGDGFVSKQEFEAHLAATAAE